MSNAILCSEIYAVCILFLLLLSVKVKHSMFFQAQRQWFFRVTVSNALFLVLDCLWVLVGTHVLEITPVLNWLLNGCYYILSGLLGFCWFAFSETVQDSRLVREPRNRRLIQLPMALLIVLTMVSFRTGWLFSVDAQNIYHRGPWYVLQLLISYGYVLFTAGKAFCLSFRTTDYRRKVELRALAAFVLPTLVAGGLQVAFPSYPVLCIGNTFGILYVYLTLQEQLISLDALTRLNNRNQLFQYLSAKLAHPREDKALYLLMMDIDYFKSINDRYGHVEGDRALKTVATSLMRACHNRNYFLSRYGGDEFVAICELDPGDSIQTVCEHIQSKLRETDTPYALTLSIGCARYTPNIRNQQEFIQLADQELYRHKKARPPRSP